MKISGSIFLLLAITFAVYLPGLSGSFYFDDEWNILKNPTLKISDLSFTSLENAANSGRAGPLGRPIAMLSFAVNYYFSGFSPFYFKITNLIVHLFSGAGVFFLSLGLARRIDSFTKIEAENFALLVSAFWLLHPLNLSPVLYVVQRMAGLSALFCIWGLVVYTSGRQKLEAGCYKGFGLIVVAYSVFFTLGLFSKENAALFPIYSILIEVIFFRFRTLNRNAKLFLIILYTGVLVFPAVFIIGYIAISPEYISGGYVIRDFNLVERLLTESRVLLEYLKQIIFPINSELGLFHDDIEVSQSIISPPITSLSVFFIVSLILSAIFCVRKSPVYSFGVLFFFGAHLMESTVIGLELMHEHRNYLASFSVLFLVAYLIIRRSKNDQYRKLKLGLAIVAILYFGFLTHMRANIWGDSNVHAFEEVKNHSESARSNYQVGRIFASYGHDLDEVERRRDYFNKAAHYFRKTAEVSESYTDGLFGLLMLEGIENKKMEEDDFKNLLSRLENSPFHHNNYNHLSALFRCLSRGVCKMESDKIAAIMTACNQNSSFKGEHRENILTYYAQHKINTVR